METSIADPDPFDTDPDRAFHFDTDPDPAFQFDADPTVRSGSASESLLLKGTVSQDFLPLLFLVNKHLPGLLGVS